MKQEDSIVAEGEVWADESWTIFRSFLEQVPTLLIMVSHQGQVLSDLFHSVDSADLEWRGE